MTHSYAVSFTVTFDGLTPLETKKNENNMQDMGDSYAPLYWGLGFYH